MSTYEKEASDMVRKFGTSNEVERMDAGVLPEEELDRIVADVIFEPVMNLGLPIRQRWKAEAIQAKAIRKGKATEEDEVTFKMIDDVDSLSAEQWVRLKQVREAMPGAEEVKPFWVVAVCGQYERRAPAVSVVVAVGDRMRRLDVYLDPVPESEQDQAKEALGLEG